MASAVERPLRIAVWHNLGSGGGMRALFNQVRGLAQRGHALEVWSPPTADLDYLPIEPWARQHVVPLDWRKETKIGLLKQVRPSNRYTYRLITEMRRHCGQCTEEMNRGGFDLLLSHPCSFMAAAPIARFFHGPSALYLQEPNRPLYEASDDYVWRARPENSLAGPVSRITAHVKDAVKIPQMRTLVREEYENAAAFTTILVNSLFSRESVLRAYGLDSRVSYLGIDTELFQDQNLPREDVVVGLGGLIPTKNPGFVIDAIGTIAPPRPKLVWIGNVAVPEYLDGLRVRAQQRGVDFEPRVRVTDSELVDILNRASLMAYASRLEPFGFAPLEANACGLPVVAVAEGGVRETVADGVNGLLVDSRPCAMGEAIAKLRREPSLARRLGSNGREVVTEKWSLTASTDRVEQNLREVVATSAQSHPVHPC